MALKCKIRINGRAPAWPVLLGEEHPFYDIKNPDELGSVSYSLLAFDSVDEEKIQWEILIDAGHNTVPFLLKHGNRLPEAIMLTHAHPDHILGVDWIVQSWYRKKSEAYPIYCSVGVLNMLLNNYPHLTGLIKHIELFPGEQTGIGEADDLLVTAYPVYHGIGAIGASMLLFEQISMKQLVLFTGDMLCPLLRKKDIPVICKTKKIFVDTNNRFPDPESNHISFAGKLPGRSEVTVKLKNWFSTMYIEDLLVPHKSSADAKNYKDYFEEFLCDWEKIAEIPHTTVDFLSLIPIPEVYLIHYWGWYDRNNYGEELLDENSFRDWIKETADSSGLDEIKFYVSKVGEFIDL